MANHKPKKPSAVTRYFTADYETTVYKGQTKTEVWAVGMSELFTDNTFVLHSIEDFFDYCFSVGDNLIIDFHNLKFDGSFILHALKTKEKYKKFKEAYSKEEGWKKLKDFPKYGYSYMISAMGQWYKIIIKNDTQIISIIDSLKLLPFSVKKIGDAFKTEHRKLEMEYEGLRYPGCNITPEEEDYIRNDVLVMKEALEIMNEQGHTKMTIGSCCLEEYKKIVGKDFYDKFFPNVYEQKIDKEKFGVSDVGKYCRRAYKGGWTYILPQKAGKILHGGITVDANSHYPSVMHSSSGNRYPVGYGTMFEGNIPEKLLNSDHYYYFITVKTRFKIKEGYLPTIQIKGNRLYKSTEWLTTSDIHHDNKYYDKIDGDKVTVTITLTCKDWELMQKHYDLYDTEILHGCYFFTEIGLFDQYIDKYMHIKETEKGVLKSLAKLFLNNLYGKFATSEDSSYKLCYINDKGALAYTIVPEDKKKPGYIPVGAAITSYARCTTISYAQANYHGYNKPGFCYADTDSIHADIESDELVGVPIHATKLCHWKVESEWSDAIFVRQKTYIEKIISEDLEPVEPYYNVKCAGMPDQCKDLFIRSLTGDKYNPKKHPKDKKLTQSQIDFINKKRTLNDFKPGLEIYGKLYATQIVGGTLLKPDYFTMRGKK